MSKKLKQTHGQVEKRDVSTYSSLEQILGNEGTGRYGTLDESEYLKEIQAMNKSDLQTHAVSVANLVPVDDRDQLETRLLREFKVHVLQYTVAKPKTKHLFGTVNSAKAKAKMKKALDIMAAGK